MYADDLVLISSRICELQKMIDDDMCGDEVNKINMQLNKNKCAICRFGMHWGRYPLLQNLHAVRSAITATAELLVHI